MKLARALLLGACGAIIAGAPVLLAAAAPECPAAERHCLDETLLADLIGWASRLSGLPAAAGDRPTLGAMPQAALAQRVCGDEAANCRGLVAVYDTTLRHIAYVDTLDLRDPTDQSYLVHELVHYLQHRQRGERLHESCEAVLASEHEAYATQNRYLVRFKQWRRVGEVMRFTRCPDGQAASEPVVLYQGALR